MRIIARQNPKLPKGALRLFLGLWFRKQLIQGEYLKQFESEFGAYLGVKHASLVSSARLGLYLLLKYYNVQDTDEVIVPSFTCPVVPSVVVAAGARPIFVDVDPSTFNMEPSLVEGAITPKTKVIVATHIEGQSCEIERILQVAKRYGLKVIEDGAQALGARYRGRKIGTFGDASYFSFATGKQINTGGGGIICTNDDALAGYLKGAVDGLVFPKESKIIKKFLFLYLIHLGSQPFFFSLFILPWIFLGSAMNADIINLLFEDKGVLKKFTAQYGIQYSNLEAAIGIRQLHSLDEDNALQACYAEIFNKLLKPHIRHSEQTPAPESIYLYYSILSEKRSQLKRRLLRYGIDTQESWNVSCATLDLFNGYGAECPVAAKLARTSLYVPHYPRLKEKDIVYIAEKLNDITQRLV